jgi:hypothetical protein
MPRVKNKENYEKTFATLGQGRFHQRRSIKHKLFASPDRAPFFKKRRACSPYSSSPAHIVAGPGGVAMQRRPA